MKKTKQNKIMKRDTNMGIISLISKDKRAKQKQEN